MTFVLGLTGPIASGKSTVANMLAELGATVVDSDKLVHEQLQADTSATRAICKAFGDDVLSPKGHVDRRKLGDKLAGDPVKIKQLEDILHPRVIAANAQHVAKARRKGIPLLVLDVPLLLKSPTRDLCDAVAVCWTAPQTRRKRALERPGMTQEKLDLFESKNSSDDEFKAAADYLIATDVPLEQTRKQVQQLYRDLTT